MTYSCYQLVAEMNNQFNVFLGNMDHCKNVKSGLAEFFISHNRRRDPKTQIVCSVIDVSDIYIFPAYVADNKQRLLVQCLNSVLHDWIWADIFDGFSVSTTDMELRRLLLEDGWEYANPAIPHLFIKMRYWALPPV